MVRAGRESARLGAGELLTHAELLVGLEKEGPSGQAQPQRQPRAFSSRSTAWRAERGLRFHPSAGRPCAVHNVCAVSGSPPR